MLQASNITLRLGQAEPLFDHLSFTVHPGQRCAVVGRNGSGKTTLFELIIGRHQPETGELTRPRDWRIAYMRQEVGSSGQAALDYVVDGHAELRRVEAELVQAEAAGNEDALAGLYMQLQDLGGFEAEARAGEILHGLGFASGTFQTPFNAFSGGWRIRLQLAQTLMAPSDLMLLDEPTNHLDLEAIVWLEGWLKHYQGTVLFISHDRRFIDGLADHVIHVHRGRATGYRGNYTTFERERALALTQQAAAHERQQQRIDEITAFARRFGAKATKARQVQSRLKALARMTEIAPVIAESSYDFRFADPDKLPHPLVHARGLVLGYGATPVLRDVAFTVLPGDRIGVIGVNGAGKSTLLKAIVGALPGQSGELTRNRSAGCAYFEQQQLDALDLSRSILETLEHPGTPQQTRDYLGRWGFAGDDLERPVATLSGGEKARLVLARLALSKPAILVLDEPTNHLDMTMRESLTVALQDYAGAVLLVSHDRELLDACVDQFWLVADGRVTTFEGDLDDYLSGKGQPEPIERTPPGAQRGPASEKRPRARRRNQHEVRTLETSFDRLTAALAELDADVARLAADGSSDRMERLLIERARLATERDAVEARWLALIDAMDNGDAPPR